MEYAAGQTGRIFTIRFDDGEDFLTGLTDLADKENIKAGWFNVIGGLREAEVVIGPVKPTMPPEPIWDKVAGAREVIGTGSLFRDENNVPRIHLHASLGEHGKTMTACVRKGTQTYLILEVYFIEIVNIEANRPWFDKGQFYQLSFS